MTTTPRPQQANPLFFDQQQSDIIRSWAEDQRIDDPDEIIGTVVTALVHFCCDAEYDVTELHDYVEHGIEELETFNTSWEARRQGHAQVCNPTR